MRLAVSVTFTSSFFSFYQENFQEEVTRFFTCLFLLLCLFGFEYPKCT